MNQPSDVEIDTEELVQMEIILMWVVRILVAAVAFFVVKWLFPAFFALMHITVPDPIPVLVALLCAIVCGLWLFPLAWARVRA